MISLQVNLDMSVALARMVTPEDLQAMTRHAGDDLRDLLKNHFIDRSQQTGSRNYWAGAAEATESHMEGRTARVTVSHTGVRLHLLGGKFIAESRQILHRRGIAPGFKGGHQRIGLAHLRQQRPKPVHIHVRPHPPNLCGKGDLVTRLARNAINPHIHSKT